MCKVNSANEVTVTPLTPVFGAEVEGVQLASATPEQLDAIKEAFWQHKVLVFRNQTLSVEQHKAFARHFGPLHVHPRYSLSWRSR